MSMQDDVRKVILALANKAKDDEKAIDAMHRTQAAANLAGVCAAFSGIENAEKA